MGASLADLRLFNHSGLLQQAKDGIFSLSLAPQRFFA
jgi:hypothetical protein